MNRIIISAAALAVLIPVAASAQGHEHGAQPQSTDSTRTAAPMQGMMEQMHEHMQAMQQMMQQMMQAHGSQGGMDMQGRSMDMQSPACGVGGPESVLSALSLGSVTDLGLTEAQSTELAAILERARDEARAALTDEQRARLAAAPSHQGAECSGDSPAHAGGAGREPL